MDNKNRNEAENSFVWAQLKSKKYSKMRTSRTRKASFVSRRGLTGVDVDASHWVPS